jgi:hypothetical protein
MQTQDGPHQVVEKEFLRIGFMVGQMGFTVGSDAE